MSQKTFIFLVESENNGQYDKLRGGGIGNQATGFWMILHIILFHFEYFDAEIPGVKSTSLETHLHANLAVFSWKVSLS